MWFALLDRSKINGTANGCTQVPTSDGNHEKHYWFSVASEELVKGVLLPKGYIYICRGSDFPDRQREDSQEWGSTVPVQPVFRIAITPEDFPFANAVLGYNQQLLQQLIETDRQGFPWFNDQNLWVVRPSIYGH
jgi:hypothetical protein